MQSNRRFTRRYNLDFIRVVATFMIILFHYNVWTERIVSTAVLLVRNYSILGAIGVSLFIILSGAALFHSTSNDLNIRAFYKGRFLALFPMFYLVYTCSMVLALVFQQYSYPAFLVHLIILKQMLIFTGSLIPSTSINLLFFSLLVIIVYLVAYIFDAILKQLFQFVHFFYVQKNRQLVS